MNEIEIVKRHLSKLVPLPLKDENGKEDIIYLKPMNIAQQAEAFELGKKFEGFDKLKMTKKEHEEKVRKIMDKETIISVSNLLVSIIKRSIEGIDDDIAEDLVVANFEALFEVIEKLLPKSSTNKGIDLIKKRQEAMKANAK